MSDKKKASSNKNGTTKKDLEMLLKHKDESKKNKKDNKDTNTAKPEKKPYDEEAISNIIAPYIFAFIGVFLVITFIFADHMSIVGALAKILFKLFGTATWLFPLAMFLVAARWKIDAPHGLIRLRVLSAGICMVFLSGFLALVLSPEIPENTGFFKAVAVYAENGGGYIGGFLCKCLHAICGNIGCGIVTGLLSVVFAVLMFGETLRDIAAFIGDSVRSLSKDVSNAHTVSQEERQKRREREPSFDKKKVPATGRKNNTAEELDIEDNDDDQDIELEPGKKKNDSSRAPKKERDLLSDFFAGDEQKAETVIPDSEIEPEETGLEGNFTGPDISAFDEAEAEKKSGQTEVDDIFCDDAVIEGAGETISAKDLKITSDDADDTQKQEVSDNEDDIPFDLGVQMENIEAEALEPEEMYEYPPEELLPGNPNPSVFKVTDELTETAKNLVTTLANFNVKTKVMNISCGPTVTRFELKPEVGVKVRSIQNLADDIALHLRASSVRIEAPIPGKDAVGIEIPNKNVSTVYIKELIDTEEFRNLPSKLSVALGMDVSGTPVYMDIAKMPHLLIAGATGMGKSVCINSFIVSILYKAKPDEVKLILIDPKKVEFAMYDSIPHLLVPVVTDPKKAAGSLAWAVNEMEHRFNLIEAAKCRDIKSYNAVCEKDSRFKKMCQIVIIIDELADLMMTARDEVETSICRLAQKARAAGMHLIIGTQRPSVDVITGVIKANVPSRIAFTVASQVDSRTILDTVGAENLVGKGDMLYAPVGCMKPTRVQGSFVGPDSVIEEITDFLRGSGIQAYDDDIQNAIELEAMKCSEKKKGKGAGDGAESYVGTTDGFERDEMMLPALELGVDMGQISTSLVQRKLALGYARAARIVDMLSEMGFVGPFEGSKPRKVLITREEYLELKMKQETGE